MIVVHDTSKTKRRFVVWKTLITENGAVVSVWFQWMTRLDRNCASWWWVADDGRWFVEHTGH